MLTLDEFNTLITEQILKGTSPNASQSEAIEHVQSKALLIVAGPGSGKTTVLVLRALKHIFVDGLLPEHLLITTFTRKAAKELRTRWLDWGTELIEAIRSLHGDAVVLEHIDLNRCRIDTLDSIVEQTLSEYRLPGEIAPVLVDESASKLILKIHAFRDIYRSNKELLDNFFARYTFEGSPPRNQAQALEVAKQICDRLVQDCVDIEQYQAASIENQLVAQIFKQYQAYQRGNNIFDFVTLEQMFLERLQEGTLDDWLSDIKALLIDEYQDTNPLQESIYFEIISQCSPQVSVVGDDDQSMYRFRGGSVELFTDFIKRQKNKTTNSTHRVDMIDNYRSSDEIVTFYNNFIGNDPAFQNARISPSKPDVVSNRGIQNFPVLGMFRDSPEKLAQDLADWLDSTFTSGIFSVTDGDDCFQLTLSNKNDLGDCVLLSHSVSESTYNHFGEQSSQIRFTGMLREELAQRNRNVFNPRGLPLRSVLNVKYLLGLVLLCLDPNQEFVDSTYPTNEAKYYLDDWREVANEFIHTAPPPSDDGGLSKFIADWQNASNGNASTSFPDDWPLLELIFKLIVWLPNFQHDPEHQVWLEAITRTITSAGMASPYGMQILKEGVHRNRSRESIIRDALVPIAENEIGVDEDIMPSVPRDYMQIMTIHQSKGLEFPLVIVDVGSHFKRSHPKQKFRRFPDSESNVVMMEDDIESFLPSPLRTHRSPLDRTFDDLVRLYYVAYSRPQSVLLLVGCEQMLRYGKEGSVKDKAIPNVALGWTREGYWPWRQTYTGKKRPVLVEPPLIRI